MFLDMLLWYFGIGLVLLIIKFFGPKTRFIISLIIGIAFMIIAHNIMDDVDVAKKFFLTAEDPRNSIFVMGFFPTMAIRVFFSQAEIDGYYLRIVYFVIALLVISLLSGLGLNAFYIICIYGLAFTAIYMSYADCRE